MKTAHFSRFSNTSPDVARQVMAGVNERTGNRPPEGAIFHAEGPTEDGGWWAFNVWESEEAERQFHELIINPILSSLNLRPSAEDHFPVIWESNHPDVRP